MRRDEFSDETGPTGLMRRADTAAVIAVKILKELYVIAEMRVGLQLGVLAEDGAPAVSIP
jgi:hypothetical protein